MEMTSQIIGQAIVFEQTEMVKLLKPIGFVKEVEPFSHVSGEVNITNKNYKSEYRNSFIIYTDPCWKREPKADLNAYSVDKKEQIDTDVPITLKELSEDFKKKLAKLEKDILNSGITGFNRDYDIACGGGGHMKLSIDDAIIIPVMKYHGDGTEDLVGFTVRAKLYRDFYGYGIITLEELKKITASKEEAITLSDEHPKGGAGGYSRDHFWHGVFKKNKVKSGDNGSYDGEGLAG